MKGYGIGTILALDVDPETWEKVIEELQAFVKDHKPELRLNTEYHVTG